MNGIWIYEFCNCMLTIYENIYHITHSYIIYMYRNNLFIIIYCNMFFKL